MSRHTTVRLPDSLLDSAKRKAAAEGRTLTSLIEEGLRHVVSRPAAKPKAPPIPVSKATGGFADLVSGLDPAKLATQLQELDDIEYVERMKSFR